MAETKLGPTSAKKTEHCFLDNSVKHHRWGYRDPRFDVLLPTMQKETGVCTINTLKPLANITAEQFLASILGVSIKTPLEMLYSLLRENGFNMTLLQAEKMMEKTEQEEPTGIGILNVGNFFFTDDHNGGCAIAQFHFVKMWNTHIWDPRAVHNCGIFDPTSRILISKLSA